MKALWRYYEIPIWLMSLLNWLILFAFSSNSVYPEFWEIVGFFTVLCGLFAWLLQRTYRGNPLRFFQCFTIGKVVKFVLTLLFLLLLLIRGADAVVNCCVTVGLLFLTTLIVDTLLFLRFAQHLSKRSI